jgi:hypothetical protein
MEGIHAYWSGLAKFDSQLWHNCHKKISWGQEEHMPARTCTKVQFFFSSKRIVLHETIKLTKFSVLRFCIGMELPLFLELAR